MFCSIKFVSQLIGLEAAENFAAALRWSPQKIKRNRDRHALSESEKRNRCEAMLRAGQVRRKTVRIIFGCTNKQTQRDSFKERDVEERRTSTTTLASTGRE